MNRKLQTVVALTALALPLVCTAQSPQTRRAVANCARAEAAALGAGLMATQYRDDSNLALPGAARVNDQIVVTAKNPDGERVAQMLCTYDGHGRVVNIHPVSPVDDLPAIDAASIG